MELTQTDQLDYLFDWLERSQVPEGYKTEIVDGVVVMWPQRDTHWDITINIVGQLKERYPLKCLLSDVRVDYPGGLNGFATDVTAVAKCATRNSKGLRRWQDVEFVAEVISKGTAANDYGPKKAAYATAEVPVYLIADPYTGQCHLFTQPKDGDYLTTLTVPFGTKLDLTNTVVDLTLKTDEFPRD
ncbi:Uma2 family endonuclease [Streptomyces sp. 4503]|uniref:Uma2 family endonuclease n=1 Tax=Streptomyces niphimycinicus TaxID=2842201 RepID=A0ABS6CUL9_9ACTN|nr:Uma2 family endonuclease [Streptomyces niphimycinicus]